MSPDSPQPPIKPDTEDTVRIISSNSQEFPPEGGTIQLSFSTSESWTAKFISSSPEGWCTASPLSGAKESQSISFSAGKNNTDATRTSVFRIVSGSASADVSISQYYMEYLALSKSEFNFGPESQTFEVSVTSNIEVAVEFPQTCTWIHQAERSPSSNKYPFLVEENNGQEARSAEIRFYGGRTNISQTLIVNQGEKYKPDTGFDSEIEIPGYEDNIW